MVTRLAWLTALLLAKSSISSALIIPSVHQISSISLQTSVEDVKRPREGHRAHTALDYGVGIGLTASYAAVSVIFKNGTITDIAKVQANIEYQMLMSRLSLSASCHPAPPYKNQKQAKADSNRQLERSRRKILHLPATGDVHILSTLLGEAHSQAEAYLQEQITDVMVTAPNLPALYAEDIIDALHHVGLNRDASITTTTTYNKYIKDKNTTPSSLSSSASIPLLNETAATIIGSGFGLCKNLNHLDRCLASKSDYPERHALSISYTHDTLSIELVSLDSKFNFWPTSASRPETHFNLGHGRLQADPSGGPFYWSTVQDTLVKPMMLGLMTRRVPSQIFLSGDQASDQQFRNVLDKVCREVLGHALEIVGENDNHNAAEGENEFEIESLRPQIPTPPPSRTFIAARGAAYIALQGGVVNMNGQ